MTRRVLLLFLVFFYKELQAEGSRELSANGGYRAFLLSQSVANLSFPFPTFGTMKVFVRAGEVIYAGSSVQGFGLGTINMRAPDGATYTSGNTAAAGFISNRSQEIAGPLPNPGGYTPYTRTVLPGQEGVWEIDFISQSNGAATMGNPVPVLADASWTQPPGQYISAFDVSVRNSTNTAFIPGRVFTNIFSGILGTFDVGFNAIFRVLTKDGYQYTLDNNGQAGNGFSFFANNKGFRTPAGLPSYLSVDDLNNPSIHDPRSADTESDITHKIFFSDPAPDLPTIAPVPGGGTTWLLNSPAEAVLSDITFSGIEGTAGIAGTAPLASAIGFTANKNGTYQLIIDVNNNGIFTDVIDRTITGNGKAGINSVIWDGIDGQGNKVQSTPSGSLTVNIRVVLLGGEVHFPFFDVERNVNGIILTRINGPGSPDNTVYWDDSPITGTGTPSVPVRNLTGLNSTVNGHKWGTSGPEPVDFGNENGIDTWGYIAGTPLVSSTTFRLREADLEVAGLLTTQTCTGNTVTYTVTVKNNGPDGASGSQFTFLCPPEISGLAVTSAVTSGTASISSAAILPGQYTATLDMENGAVMTFTITGNITSVLPGTTATVTAAILRSPDNTDPDASNPDAAPPADAAAECGSSPSGVGCNNIKSVSHVIFSPIDAGPDQTITRYKLATLTANGTGMWTQLGNLPLVAVIQNPGDPTTLVGGFKAPGAYGFIFTGPNGCSDTVTINVILGAPETQIPNVITPNGDGRNDVFEILGGLDFPGSQLIVFNRWGNEVYRSANYKNDWDGNGLAEGTYYYVYNRRETGGGSTPLNGWVYLKRN